MSISKTRQKLIDIARQLFAKRGVANTTMNDIAVASGKGRRTLYTYFNSKEEVYSAVIESELERLSDKLDEVAAMKMRPLDKVIELIYTHLSMIRETVVRNGNLRAEFFRNIWMVEKVRKKFDDYEIDLFSVSRRQGRRRVRHRRREPCSRHHPLLHKRSRSAVHLRTHRTRAHRRIQQAARGEGGVRSARQETQQLEFFIY